jgi:transcription factor C subunit 3
MQFILLSIIAAHGADGIYQPELVRLSGQDKRSVPHRTDELAKAGYIEKTPITLRGLRTSLCVHKRFVKEGHFLRGSSNFEDVFRNRAVILSALVEHLYNILKETPILRYTQLRTALVSAMQCPLIWL